MANMKVRAYSKIKGKLIEYALLTCALTSTIVVILIFFFLFSEGIPFFTEVNLWQFFGGKIWLPLSPSGAKYGILPLMAGTALVTIGAIAISVPMGILCSTYLSEVAHPLIRESFKPIIEILAGIPSVVYGFIALTAVADIVQGTFGTVYRLNALNGAIILAVMMTPTIVSISEDAMIAVPREYREASFALGATRWETARMVVLPSSLSGIIIAIMLGIGRAVGETMAVLMATGNAPVITFNIFRSVETMTAVIAIEMGEVTFGSIHYSALFAVGIVLFIITLAINISANLLFQRYKEMGR